MHNQYEDKRNSLPVPDKIQTQYQIKNGSNTKLPKNAYSTDNKNQGGMGIKMKFANSFIDKKFNSTVMSQNGPFMKTNKLNLNIKVNDTDSLP